MKYIYFKKSVAIKVLLLNLLIFTYLINLFFFLETMLNENDCPQEVMSEKSGQNFTLAYRRIDAKIAWPQQALLSYP